MSNLISDRVNLPVRKCNVQVSSAVRPELWRVYRYIAIRNWFCFFTFGITIATFGSSQASNLNLSVASFAVILDFVRGTYDSDH